MCLREIGIGRDGLLKTRLRDIPMALFVMTDPFIVVRGSTNLRGGEQGSGLRIHRWRIRHWCIHRIHHWRIR